MLWRSWGRGCSRTGRSITQGSCCTGMSTGASQKQTISWSCSTSSQLQWDLVRSTFRIRVLQPATFDQMSHTPYVQNNGMSSKSCFGVLSRGLAIHITFAGMCVRRVANQDKRVAPHQNALAIPRRPASQPRAAAGGLRLRYTAGQRTAVASLCDRNLPEGICLTSLCVVLAKKQIE